MTAKLLNKFVFLKRLKNIGCGCLLITLLLLVLGLIFSGVVIRKLISGTIREKTGVVQTTPLMGTGQSYTDPKTGATINLGVNKVPDSFPKDFPIYPGATVTTSQTGSGFWLTLTTKDSVDEVNSFYKTSLATNNWQQVAGNMGQKGESWVVGKDNLTGYLTITSDNNLTSIIIVLGEVNK